VIVVMHDQLVKILFFSSACKALLKHSCIWKVV
jgi:hypothetical protein